MYTRLTQLERLCACSIVRFPYQRDQLALIHFLIAKREGLNSLQPGRFVMDVPDGESAGRMPVSWCICAFKGSAPLIPRVVELVREFLKRLQLKVGKCGHSITGKYLQFVHVLVIVE